MKKVLFFLAAMLMIPMVHAAPEFKEGVNYDVVKQTGSAQPEVMEFFSYYCPHCATFEPIVEQLQAGSDLKDESLMTATAKIVAYCLAVETDAFNQVDVAESLQDYPM